MRKTDSSTALAYMMHLLSSGEEKYRKNNYNNSNDTVAARNILLHKSC
jgi:hypothetical protein